MRGAILILLGAICLIGFSKAEKFESEPGVTYVEWLGESCSGMARSRIYGEPLGCSQQTQRWRPFGRVTECENATGAVFYDYVATSCTGIWYRKYSYAVNQCIRADSDTSIGTFCGKSHAVSLHPSKSRPVEGDGKASVVSSTCMYYEDSMSDCPTNKPFKVKFDDSKCQKPSDTVADILYGGLSVGKCYLLLDEDALPINNIEAKVDKSNNLVSIFQYNSGLGQRRPRIRRLRDISPQPMPSR